MKSQIINRIKESLANTDIAILTTDAKEIARLTNNIFDIWFAQALREYRKEIIATTK